MVLAMANPNTDILGHCTGRKVLGPGGRGRPQSQFDAEVVFAACAQFDKAVEINCRPERQDPPEELLELALDWECKVSIDTDAHAPGQLEWQPYGCDKAARLGVPVESGSSTPGPPTNSWPGRRPTQATEMFAGDHSGGGGVRRAGSDGLISPTSRPSGSATIAYRAPRNVS